MKKSTQVNVQSLNFRCSGFAGLTDSAYQPVRQLRGETCQLMWLIRANTVPVTLCLRSLLRHPSACFHAKLTLTAFLAAIYKLACKAYLLPRGGMFRSLRQLTGKSGSFAFNLPIAGEVYGSLTGSSLLTSLSLIDWPFGWSLFY